MIILREWDPDEYINLIRDAYIKREWEFFFNLCPSHIRQELFYLLKDEMLPDIYWKMLGVVLTDKSIFDNKLKKCLTDKSKNLSKRYLLMDGAEYQKFLKLPNTITIYRGEGNNGNGWSWTLNKKIADKFAKRHHSGRILKAEAEKIDIIAYFDNMEEAEIIVPYEKVKNICIIKRKVNGVIIARDSKIFQDLLIGDMDYINFIKKIITEEKLKNN